MNTNLKTLSINGGKPVRSELLSYGKQWINKDDINSVVNVLNSEFISSGPKIKEFEMELAKEAGCKYAVTFSSGTAALHASCFVAEIKVNDEVIVPPLTFVASSNCILYMGATPIFADVDLNTFNLDPLEVKNKINEKTKAIIIVDFAGQPASYEEISKLASIHGLVTIRDAAHSIGSIHKGKKVGQSTDMTIFSFHPVKHITTGEGGAVVTDDERLYKKLLKFRNHGMTRDKDELLLHNSPEWYYEVQSLGYNYRMTEMQSALGLSQLNRLDQFVERRIEIASIYNSAFKEMEGIDFQASNKDSFSSWHLYILRWKKGMFKVSRNKIYDSLIAENIGVNLHYKPVYLHPLYKSLGFKKGLCPNAEILYEEFLTIPLYPKMTNKDVNDVINAVKKVYDYYIL